MQVLHFQACYLANPFQGSTIRKGTGVSGNLPAGAAVMLNPELAVENSGERSWGCHWYHLRTLNHQFNMQRQPKQPTKRWTPSRQQDSMVHLPWYKTREYKNSRTTDKLTDIKGSRQDISSLIPDAGLLHYGPLKGARLKFNIASAIAVVRDPTLG